MLSRITQRIEQSKSIVCLRSHCTPVPAHLDPSWIAESPLGMPHRRTSPLPAGGRGWEPTGFLGEGDEDGLLLQKLAPNCSIGMLICRT